MSRRPPVEAAGPFLFETFLARGGSGEVWRGRHRVTGVPVALKVLSEVRADRRALAFRRELVGALHLDHPHALRLLDAGWIDPERPWLAVELASGTLDERVGTLRWPEIRAVLLDLLSVLAHAHARGLTHLDVKPANVLSVDGVWKLGDFGLAHLLDPEEGVDGGIGGGTPTAMAPEQWRRAIPAIGPWTDLYAVGCTAWELCTGGPVFETATPIAQRDRHLSARVPAFRPTMAVPEGLSTWLERLLEKDPADRFRHAADARAALEALDDLADDLAGPSGFRERALGEATFAFDAVAPLTAGSWATLSEVPSAPAPARWVASEGQEVLLRRPWPLVGRDGEVEVLLGLMRVVSQERKARLLGLVGPPGVGLSRLAREAGQVAAERGQATLLVATHHRTPGEHDGIEGALRRYLRCTGADERPQVSRSVTLPGSLDTLLRAGTAAAAASPRERAAWSIEILTALAQERPVWLVLDDVELDPNAWALATRLAEASLPLLIVANSRAELCRATLAVDPLPTALLADTLERVLGFSATSADDLARGSGGLPGRGTQLLALWVRRGLLRPAPDGSGLTADAGDLGLDQVWETLADLPDQLGQLAWCASFQGRQVDLAVLDLAAATCGLAVPSDLADRWETAGLGVPDDRMFGFVSDELVVVFRRRARAAGAAPAMRAATGAAGLREGARDRDDRRFVRAAFRLEVASACLDDPADLARADHLLGDCLRNARRAHEADVPMLRAIATWERLGDDAALGRTLTNLGILYYQRNRQQDAAALLDRALTLHLRVGDLGAHVRTLGTRARVAVMLGDLDGALEALRQPLSSGTDTDPALRRRLELRLAEVTFDRSVMRPTEGVAEARAMLVAAYGDSSLDLRTRQNIGWRLFKAAMCAEDRVEAERALREMPPPELRWEGWALQLAQARVRDDRVLLRELCRFYNEQEAVEDLGWFAHQLGCALEGVGDLEGARRCFESVADEAAGAVPNRVMALTDLARVIRDDRPARRSAFNEALRLARAHGFVYLEAQLLVDEALALRAEGDVEESARLCAALEALGDLSGLAEAEYWRRHAALRDPNATAGDSPR